MNELSRYIAVIHHGREAAIEIVNTSSSDHSYLDQGINVSSIETTYTFSNRVVIKRRIEYDEVIASAELCAECWISYEVIAPFHEDVQPAKKSFINPCQESFWLKMQLAEKL